MSASSSQALEYLEGLPGTIHKRLYQQPSAVLAVFRRMLPHLAKTIVMAMLYMTGPFPATELDTWIRQDSKGDKDKAISVLESLHIITQAQETSGSRAYRLSSGFQNSLRQALTGGGNHRSFGVPCVESDLKKVSIDRLDLFARGQWEAILHYMVGSAGSTLGGGAEISPGTKTLLDLGHFIESRGGRATITQAGFSFLLQEVNAQVWSLLIVYLENAHKLKMDNVDVLSFLFMLGSLELGQDYSTGSLTETQLQMLDDLNDFGIVYRTSSKSKRFYPTRLATTLTSDAAALNNADSFSSALNATGTSGNKGYIIIETNYRLYAYTSSELQIAVLNLFTELETRFPNLVSGKLTKESIQRAIGLGITSDQIISYLDTYAHPQMQRKMPVLPPTVVDQIRLWQIEGDRMRSTEGFLFKDFKDWEEYRDLREYADHIGVLVWSNDARRLMFLTRVEQISQFIKNRQKRA
ncbi:putative tfiih and nucleotide excision repair factor 3 complexes subunit protein [Neofusicoccum parvum UCRNP2]|uniref:RNA polymerase II transcription factor B subunit 2 n=2 Tax=Neofusicoccum parvum TaxID=310453 RepID=R1GML8_BOTPV|nr:putative tfiih and nucleotide excision repair factor 3 complexes subunit protein [Neofusicoccum parvum UCRNP2]GME28263.1 Tfiih and nucleotide excision repair factor 3 complexes subunit protein [Neofusicoccum parvum]